MTSRTKDAVASPFGGLRLKSDVVERVVKGPRKDLAVRQPNRAVHAVLPEVLDDPVLAARRKLPRDVPQRRRVGLLPEPGLCVRLAGEKHREPQFT